MDTQILMIAIQDDRLTLEEKGLLAVLLCRDKNPYSVAPEQIEKSEKFSHRQFQCIAKRLVKFGYFTPRYSAVGGVGDRLVGYTINLAAIQRHRKQIETAVVCPATEQRIYFKPPELDYSEVEVTYDDYKESPEEELTPE